MLSKDETIAFVRGYYPNARVEGVAGGRFVVYAFKSMDIRFAESAATALEAWRNARVRILGLSHALHPRSRALAGVASLGSYVQCASCACTFEIGGRVDRAGTSSSVVGCPGCGHRFEVDVPEAYAK